MNETRARSTAGGHYFLGNKIVQNTPIFLNGAIYSLCKVMGVAASAAEAELGSLFLNTQEAVKLRIALDEMGHKQPPTPIHTDNTTASGIVHGTIKQQRSRAMNMRYFWTVQKQKDKTIDVSWHPGKENLGDYVTKHHPSNIHRHVRPLYLHTATSPRFLQRYATPHLLRGCAKTPTRSTLHVPRSNLRVPRITLRIPRSSLRVPVSPYNSMARIPTRGTGLAT